MNIERKLMKLKYQVMGSTKHKNQKAERLAMIKEARTNRTFENSRDYLIVANKISGHKRIESRARVNRIIVAKAEQKNGK